MAITVGFVNGENIQFGGATGLAGTSINLNVVAVTTIIFSAQQGMLFLPLFLFLRRFSTGAGAVPTATFTAGSLVPAAPVDWIGATVLSGNGPDQCFQPAGNSAVVPQLWSTPFRFAITAGAVGTCDVEVYGVVQGR